MKIRWYKYLVYVSLVFLLITLYYANYLKIPIISSYYCLGLSFSFLFGGFTADALSWKSTLVRSGYNISFKESLAGVGLSIFTKYIPGKILIIMGRAVYVAERMNYPINALSALSLNAQLIALWIGLSMGTVGIFILEGILIWKWFLLLLWISLSSVIFSRVAHLLLERAIRFFFRKDIKIPQLDIISVFKVMPLFLVCWGCWSIAFYFLASSLQTSNTPLVVGLVFPLCGTLGMLAGFAPGGIGVREGLIVSCLMMAGFEITEATTISIASRLWFLIGESFIFVSGLITDKLLKG